MPGAASAYNTGASNAMAGIFGGVMGLVYLAIAVLAIIALWKIFTKAGEAGWQAIIPIWNTLVLLKIVGRPMWWIILLLIPFVNLVILVIVMNDLSKSFGHGVGFTLGLIFLSVIFFMILGFGSSEYVGPRGVRPMPAYAPSVAAGYGAPPAPGYGAPAAPGYGTPPPAPSYPAPAPSAAPPAPSYPPPAPPAAPASPGEPPSVPPAPTVPPSV